MKTFVNELVKGRECFHYFKPSVLEEYVDEWFDMSQWGGDDSGGGEAGVESRGVAKAKAAWVSQQPVDDPNR